ncbi:MAG TPA: nitrogenase component 1, partial [Cellvibrionaceae bacterium]|nr:nitrogenase component 1 [Cellvibrionaceae bacterium]
QDAMLDTHFMIGQARVAIAANPDMLLGFERLLTTMGAEVVAAVVPDRAKSLEASSITTIQIGDLEDLERRARAGRAQLMIANSHAAESAERLGVPLLRAGFPQYDLLGGFQRLWFGYRGTTQALFDLANLINAHHQETKPYNSIYAQKLDGPQGQPAAIAH